MTTITVEIDKDKDLSAVEEFIAGLGLTYHILPAEPTFYTDDLKNTLDQRYDDYLQGKVELIEADDSKEKIAALLAGKSK